MKMESGVNKSKAQETFCYNQKLTSEKGESQAEGGQVLEDLVFSLRDRQWRAIKGYKGRKEITFRPQASFTSSVFKPCDILALSILSSEHISMQGTLILGGLRSKEFIYQPYCQNPTML
jgi:hypothetical protein